MNVSPPANFDPVELCKLESSIMGIMAGFALTVVISLITQGERLDKRLSGIAIKLFIGAFFVSTYASFVYAVGGSLTDRYSIKSYFWLLSAGYILALSTFLLTLGIIYSLSAFKGDEAGYWSNILTYAANFVIWMHFSVTVSVVLNIAKFNSDPLIVLTVSFAIPLIIGFGGYILRRKIYQKHKIKPLKATKHEEYLRRFVVVVISTSCAVSIIDVYTTVTALSYLDEKLLTLLTLIIQVGLFVLVNWGMLFRPAELTIEN